jgi:hypothetical protein
VRRITARQAGALAVIWLFLALFFGALYRFADGSERHAYNSQSTPPSAVRLTQGKHYQLSTVGGQTAMAAADEQIATANCVWQLPGGAPGPLGVTGLSPDSGATHVVGTFVAPATGSIEITCSGLGPVFIDDADNSGTDLALAFLLLSSGLATVGVVLGLWALHEGLLTPKADADSDADSDGDSEDDSAVGDAEPRAMPAWITEQSPSRPAEPLDDPAPETGPVDN